MHYFRSQYRRKKHWNDQGHELHRTSNGVFSTVGTACAAAETLQAKATLAICFLSPTAWPSERGSKVPGAGSTQTNRGENWGRGDAIAMSEKERPPTTRNWRPRPTTAAWWPYSFYSFQDCRRPHPARAAWWLKFIGPCEHNVQNQSHQFCLDIAEQMYFSREPYVDTKRFMHENRFSVAPQHCVSNPIKQSIGPVDPCSCIHSCASRI
jgi:hypothetical protein